MMKRVKDFTTKTQRHKAKIFIPEFCPFVRPPWMVEVSITQGAFIDTLLFKKKRSLSLGKRLPDKRPYQEKGFTLLEMLVAIAIFSIISLSAWQIFQGVMTAHDVVLTKNERLRQLQYTLLLIDQDLQQIADRGTRVDNRVTAQSLFSDSQMLDSDDEALALVRHGWHNPDYRLPRPELQRVFYRLRDNRLERQYHHVLDPASINVEPVTQTLLTDINSLKFSFYINGQWRDSLLLAEGSLPEGLKIEFDMSDFGRIERRYILPASWQPAS
ncbi:type II secretion system minor pseudopilin GspJ [Endozoicomonas acroporae]|uniref:type II secretion system minor pseudopilin GspJ n=1 Tax=Endozoicomonas acroporae TaxID=1701104 RepID=UPI000C769DA3|nr:type II secretion system minor pseudopilin GspJ [Endozoicomonas acroporae]